MSEFYYYVEEKKIALSILLMTISIPSLAANAQGQEPSSNEFNQYIKDAIEQEIQVNEGDDNGYKVFYYAGKFNY
ncbi:hypothetical protein [Paenibacillus polymyxa]|uniref:hypothetical protein n=1 Tax=Paenibacillus polymyxa TaxID=1406 RepID=UPI0008FB16C7|nr:hypothetical protein [Paenibacillus polymyxa]